MKVLPKSNREHKQEMKAALTKGHIDFVLSVAADRKLSFSAALNWIIDQEMNRQLYQLLTRSA